MKARRPAEGRDELWARGIVRKLLGVPVDRFDDGTAKSIVDAVVRCPDRKAALEVVTDVDEDFIEQGDVLHRKKNYLIKVSGLRDSWMVILCGSANINDVKQALPKLLPAWQDNPPPKRSCWDTEPSELRRLGIESVSPIRNSTASGGVWLMSGGRGREAPARSTHYG